ncbi:TPA: ead/Ea22-like family protein [Escherichia coli]
MNRRQPVSKINYQALREAAEKALHGEWGTRQGQSGIPVIAAMFSTWQRSRLAMMLAMKSI